MTLWSAGTSEFNSHLEQQSNARVLADDCALTPGDTVIVQLGASDVAADVSALVERGAHVLVACQPADVSRAVSAVNAGATDILLEPLSSDTIASHVASSDEHGYGADDEITAWRARYASGIVGRSSALLEALEMASRAAEFDCPVLITGESGTGKELLAKALHDASPRAAAPYVPVNCPAIPGELVESELFGHARGAFTGATNARVGRFSAANKGTLFLDEIGEMDLNVQSKLLRVLQDYRITPVGETRSQRVDVRVIAATNRDLETESSQGKFREDLFYRLNVVQIRLPSLRERREDIALLVEHFLTTISEERGVEPPRLSEAAREALSSYDWPGNVRQLRNTIERLVILQRGRVVEPRHLPAQITRERERTQSEVEGGQQASPRVGGFDLELPPEGIDLRSELLRLEARMIRKALDATHGNKNQAAKILGLNRTTLVEKLKKRPLAMAS
ncbi:MAG: sigma-54-dependent Fis family transcriptional regulator [Myxococcales bacterium]|nr:sigma-54-dependent Fis family transcriptional regulator [Myxococcales bacterium]